MTQPVYLATGQTVLQVIGSTVYAYGAKGNGITDDSAAIQAGVNALSGTGLPLILPAATFVVANPINVSIGNITIVGSPGTVLKSTINPAGGAGNQESIFVGTAATGMSGTVTTTINPGATSFACSFNPGGAGTIIAISTTAAVPRVMQYTVANVMGTGPFTVTVERPIRRTYVNGSSVVVLNSRPSNIRIWGNGMKLTGTGQRYWCIVLGYRCELADVITDNSGGSLVAEYQCSFDSGGLENIYRRCKFNLGGASAAIAFEANEAGRIEDCEIYNSTASGVGLFDCDDVTIENCRAWGCPTAGVQVASLNSSPGSDSTRLIGGSYNGNGSGVIISQGSSNNQILDASCQYNTTAGVWCSASGAASTGTKIANCALTNNTGIGLLVDPTVTATVGVNLDLSGNAGGVNGTALQSGTGTDVHLTGIRAYGLGSYGFIVGGSFDMSGFDIQTSVASNFLISNINTTGPAASQIRLVNGHMQLDGNSDAGVLLVQPASGNAVAYLTQVRMDGAGSATSGVAINSNCIARLGEGVNMSALTTPINLAGSGKCNRKGTVVANGTTGVAVGFLDIYAQDTVHFILQTVGGTVGLPKYTITAGTGFTFTSTNAADTSTYEWFIP